ncbi:MAG: GAF domain-containing protein [Chthoniobacterales bacterium]
MFTGSSVSNLPKPEVYREIASQLRGLIADEPDPVANMANCAAIIFNSVPGLNWAGFYLLKGGELVLGPFQGKPACVRIPFGHGVCGTAAQNRTLLCVPDVNAFDDHIACDSDSRSEIVIPMLREDTSLIGVLDVDSPQLGHFDAEDEAGLREIAKLIGAKL